MMRPMHLPLWIVMLGNISIAMVVLVAVLLVLPHSVLSKSKQLRRLRLQLLRGFRRVGQLSAQGPFYRLFVWCGRKGGCGRCASRCRAPGVPKVRPSTCSDMSVSFLPSLPLNPFHEEKYIVAHRRAYIRTTAPWHEQVCDRHNDCAEASGGRLKVVIGQLPEHASVHIRVCADNIWGRSDWSEEVEVKTLARPNKEGGFTGPVGPAGPGGARSTYSWTQTPNEVSVRLPIGDKTRAKDISFKATPSRLEIRCPGTAADSDELLVGVMPKRVKADEVSWFIEESEEHGRHLALQMVKAEPMTKWPCLLEDSNHPRIDTGLVAFFTKGLGMGGLDIFE